MSAPADIRQRALDALCENDPQQKVDAVHALWNDLPHASLDASATLTPTAALPGRPPRPLLLPPMQVPTRSPFTPEGLAALLHAITHIEFNAIKLNLKKASLLRRAL